MAWELRVHLSFHDHIMEIYVAENSGGRCPAVSIFWQQLGLILQVHLEWHTICSIILTGLVSISIVNFTLNLVTVYQM